MDDNALLQAIGKMIDDKLDSKLQPIKDDIQDIKVGQAAMQDDIADIKNRVTTIEVVQENKVFTGIQLLAEGHSGLVDKLELLEDVPERIEGIQNDISVLKTVFAEHIRE